VAADIAQVECWLLQAEADFQAAKATAEGILECHKRYWFQQSCEKAIKAYGLLRFDPASAADEKAFVLSFLRHHAPFTEFDASIPTSRAMHLLQREIGVFLRELPTFDTIEQIESTKPRMDPQYVSYRYPFKRATDPACIAPAAHEGWEVYQGNAMKVERAVRDLLRAVTDELKTARRAPR
jgi:HEPN domain-containing protein